MKTSITLDYNEVLQAIKSDVDKHYSSEIPVFADGTRVRLNIVCADTGRLVYKMQDQHGNELSKPTIQAIFEWEKDYAR